MKRSQTSDGNYRYRLSRAWGEPTNRHILWVLLNPSIADDDRDSSTIRRVIGLTSGWGFNSLVVVNLYAYRAVNPEDLWAAAINGHDINGPENDRYIIHAASQATRIVVGWGSRADFHRPRRVYRLLTEAHAKPLLALGETVSGHPIHPLRVPRDTKPRKWKPTTQILQGHD